MIRKILVSVLLLFQFFVAHSKNENIKEVVAKKSDYLNTEFTLKGIIHKSTDSMSAKSYLLVDQSNDSLEIRLEKKQDLEIGAEYKFEGKLKQEQNALFFKVNEIKCLDCENDDDDEGNLMFTLTLIVVILAVVIVYLIRRQQLNKIPGSSGGFPTNPGNTPFNSGPIPSTPSNVIQPNPTQVNQGASTDNFATIAFNPNLLPKQTITESKTVVMNQPKSESSDQVPGNFIVNTNGSEENLKLKGLPTSLGNIVTVGREDVSGDEAKYHLRLNDQTVSRKQAELIYESQNLYIRT